MSFGFSPTGSHDALYIQSYNMESAPQEVRRNASWIMSTQPCGSAQFLLISWRHWRPTEKRGGTCVRRAWRPSTSTIRRGGRGSSRPSTHGHKHSDARLRAKDSSSLSPPVTDCITSRQPSGLPWVWGFPWGFPWVWVWYGYGGCDESPWVLWGFCGDF